MNTGFELDLRGYPLLETAWWGEAFNPKVEWLRDIGNRTEDGNVRYHASFNYCQIFRNDSLEDLLADVEATLESAREPQLIVGSQHIGLMGGVRYFVPRGRFEHTIRVLRPLMRRKIDARIEYLTELSVQVVASNSIRDV